MEFGVQTTVNCEQHQCYFRSSSEFYLFCPRQNFAKLKERARLAICKLLVILNLCNHNSNNNILTSFQTILEVLLSQREIFTVHKIFGQG